MMLLQTFQRNGINWNAKRQTCYHLHVNHIRVAEGKYTHHFKTMCVNKASVVLPQQLIPNQSDNGNGSFKHDYSEIAEREALCQQTLKAAQSELLAH